jgi:uncharacterized damage-inducible protein DinB
VTDASPVTVSYYRWLFKYSYWARDRLLAQVAKLDYDGYIAPRALDYGSIRGTLVQLARDAIWFARWRGIPDELIGEADLPTFEGLQRRWMLEEAQMRAFLTQLTDSALSEPVHYVSALSGKRYAIPLWHLMSHVVSHGIQHRSEVALVITWLGLSPGDLDLIVYLNPVPM